jgi:hypothetical protein
MPAGHADFELGDGLWCGYWYESYRRWYGLSWMQNYAL